MLITANHILHYHGIVDAYGHISIRHPQNPKIYVMSGYMAPALVTSSEDLIEYWVADSEPVGSPFLNKVIRLIQPLTRRYRLTGKVERRGMRNALFMGRYFECTRVSTVSSTAMLRASCRMSLRRYRFSPFSTRHHFLTTRTLVCHSHDASLRKILLGTLRNYC